MEGNSRYVFLGNNGNWYRVPNTTVKFPLEYLIYWVTATLLNTWFSSNFILPSPVKLPQHLLETSVISISVNYKRMCELCQSWVLGRSATGTHRARCQPSCSAVSSLVNWWAAQHKTQKFRSGEAAHSMPAMFTSLLVAMRSCTSLCMTFPFRRRLIMN